MSDLNSLEDKLLADVAAAGDESALEAVRIAALGKSGSVSALLKTLGAMTLDEALRSLELFRAEVMPKIDRL